MSPELLQPEGIALGEGLASSDLAVRVQAVQDTLAATFAKPLTHAEHNRMLAFNAMAPRALQIGYGRVGSEGSTRRSACRGACSSPTARRTPSHVPKCPGAFSI
ncbi:hypothetical protein NKH18_09455 [Streptomyces sp. M10(2022)]